MTISKFKITKSFLIGSALSIGLSAATAIADIRFWTTEEQPARLAKHKRWLSHLKQKLE